MIILFFYRKHSLIRLFQMKMKELILKVKTFYERTIQVTKREVFVCIVSKKHLPIIKRDDLCTLKECLVTEIIVDKKSFFCVCIDHQVRLMMNLRSFVMAYTCYCLMQMM